MVVSLIKQLTPVLKKNHFYHFYLSQLFSFGQLWNSPVTCRYFKNVFYKSPDNNDPRANSRTMSKFVTIYSITANWQIFCFIAKFSINLQFWYKLLVGLSWGQSLHQNCKDVKLHITCLIPGLAFISPAIFFTWHNLTCVHWLTPNTTRFVIRWLNSEHLPDQFTKIALLRFPWMKTVLAVTSGSFSQCGQTTPCCLSRHKYVRSEV